jgi:pimeloyl-ACP methyl ester carboxylesterase
MNFISTFLFHSGIYAIIYFGCLTIITISFVGSLLSYFIEYGYKLYATICKKHFIEKCKHSDTRNVMNCEKSFLQEEIENKNIEVIDNCVTFVANNEYYKVNIHMLFSKASIHSNKEESVINLLFIHGMNTGPMYFSPFLKEFSSNGYNVYSISIPGFGLVDIPKKALSYDSQELLNFYSEYLKKLIDNYFHSVSSDSGKIIIIAHSFGAFISGYFYSKYPESIDRLLFINGIGLFPFTGNTGKWWSTIFKLGFPVTFMRLYFKHMSYLFYLYIWYMLGEPFKNTNATLLWYYFSLATCSTNYSDIICAKFIDFGYFYSFWNFTIADIILHKNLRIHFIWGVDDPIIPCYLAKIITDVSYCTELESFTLHIINGGGHEPTKYNSGKDFISVFNSIMDISKKSVKNKEPLYSDSSKLLPLLLSDKMSSTYEANKTSTNLKKICNVFSNDCKYMNAIKTKTTFITVNEVVKEYNNSELFKILPTLHEVYLNK